MTSERIPGQGPRWAPDLRNQQTLPELERTERQQAADDRGDPQPDHHLGLLQPAQFQMMVERRHAEDALAPGHMRDHVLERPGRTRISHGMDDIAVCRRGPGPARGFPASIARPA